MVGFTSNFTKKTGLFFLFSIFCYLCNGQTQNITGDIECKNICCIDEIISITANCTGTEDLNYQFSIDGQIVQEYSNSFVYKKTMSEAATHVIKVDVRSESDTTITTSYSKKLEVKSKPKANAGTDVVLCEGETTGLGMNAESGIIYTWSPIEGLNDPEISNPTTNSFFTPTSGSGVKYTLTATWDDLKTCYSQDEVNVIMHKKPEVNPGSEKIICAGTSIQLGMTPIEGVNYSWSPASELENSMIANPTTKPLNSSVIFTMSASIATLPSCKSDTSIRIEVIPIPEANAGIDIMICEGSAVRIGSNAQSNITYNWTPIHFLEDASIANPVTLPLSEGLYSFKLTASSSKLSTCSSTDEVIVTVKKKPVAFAGQDITICEGTTTQIGRIGEKGISYLWFPQLVDDFNSPNPMTTLLNQTTTYTLYASWDTLPSCASSDQVTVTIKKNPSVTAGGDTIICEGTSAQLGKASDNSDISYLWTPNMLNATNIPNPITKAMTNSMEFIVTASTISLPICKSKDSVFVDVKKNSTIYSVRGGGSYCAGGDLTYNIVKLSSSETSSKYALFKDGYQISAWINGTGSELEWNRLQAGTYTVSAQNDLSCTVSMQGSAVVSEFELPTAIITATPTNVCPGDEATIKINFTGVPPFSCILENSNGKRETISTNLSTYEFTTFPLANSTWKIIQLTDYRCNNYFKEGNPEASIKTNALPTSKINIKDNKTYICKKDSAVLFVDFPLPTETYRWSTGDTARSISVSPIITSTYYLTSTNEKGCKFIDSFTVKVRELPQVSIAGLNEDMVYCSNEEKILLTGIPAGGSFSGSGIDGDYFDPSKAVGTGTITYEYIDIYGCKGDSVATVYVNQAPEVNFTIPDLEFGAPYMTSYSYCTPLEKELYLQGIPKIKLGKWKLYSANPNELKAELDTTRANLPAGGAYLINCGPGTYNLEYSYTDNKNCTGKIVKDLTIYTYEPENIDMGELFSMNGDTLCSLSNSELIKADLTGGSFTVDEKLFVSQDMAQGQLIINPSKVTAPSTYGIGYTFVDNKGCPHNLYKEVYVTTPVNVRPINLESTYCEYDEDVLFGYTSYFSTTGKITIVKDKKDTVFANINNGELIYFKPQWGAGEYEVIYIYSDKYCEGVPFITKVNVYPRPDIHLTIPTDFCYGDTIPLTAIPDGGRYFLKIGDEKQLLNKKLDTKETGTGKQTFYYEYTSQYGCINYDTSIVQVNGIESVKLLNLKPEYCENNGEIVISGFPISYGIPSFHTSSSINGFLTDRGDGYAVLDLSKLNFKGTYDITYRYVQEYTKVDATTAFCTTETKQYFSILGKNADFAGYEDKDTICGILDSLILTGNQENKGRFEISDPTLNGMVDNGNGTAILYPQKLVEKNYSVTFIYDHYDENGNLICTTEKTKSFYLSPIKDFKLEKTCNNDETVIRLTGSETSATYILYANAFAVDTIQGTGSAIEFKPISEDAYCKVYVIKRGCMTKLTDEIHIKPFDVKLIKTDISCYKREDGKATAIITGGVYPYDASWHNSTGFTVKDTFATSLKPGKYYFEMTDSIGCHFFDSLIINEPDTLSIIIDEFTSPACMGENSGTAKAIVSGGTPNYFYEWKKLPNLTVVGNSATLTDIESGTYEVTVTDKNKCTASDRTTLIQNEKLKIKIDKITDNEYYGDENGEIFITVTGGVTPYSYLWKGVGINSVNKNSEDLTNLPAGNYFLIVTDANGCTEEISTSILQPEIFSVQEIITPLKCKGDNTGSISLIITGGQSRYTVTWEGENNFQSSEQNISGLATGIYNVTVKDINNKEYKNSYKVKEPKELELFVLSHTNTTLLCYNDSTGTIEIDVKGGTTPYSIEWVSSSISAGENNSMIYENLPADNYLVKITDFNGCKTSRNFEITQPDKILNNGTVKNVSCADRTDGAITLSTNGGIAPYNYFWTGGNVIPTNKNQSKLAPSTYYLEIEDYNGCITKDTFIIKSAVLSTATLAMQENLCSEDSINLRFDFTGTSNWDVAFTDGAQSYTFNTDQSPYFVKVAPEKNTIYNIIGASDGKGCNTKYTGEAEITVLPSPNLILVNHSSDICYEDSATIEVFLQQGTRWNITYKDIAGERKINNITTPQFKFKIAPSRTGTLSYEILSVENEYCKKAINLPFTVNVHKYPTLAVTAPSFVCEGNESSIKMEFTGDAPWYVDYYAGDLHRTDIFYEKTTYIKDILHDNTAYQFKSVTSGFGCKTETDKKINVEIGILPLDAQTITGSTIGCIGETKIFTTPKIANATSYHWTLPDGIEIAGGTGSNEVLLRFTDNAESGLITVQGKNSCGLGGFASLYIRIPEKLGKAGTIYSLSEVCKNADPIEISTSLIENAESYEWELPGGFIIDFGENTSSIIASLQPDVQAGTIKVWGKNICYNSDTATANIKILTVPSTEAGPALTTNCENRIKMEARNPSPNTGTWKLIEGRGVIANINDPNTEITNLGYGRNVFYWEVTNGKCTDIDSVTVTNVNVDMTQPEFYEHTTCLDTLTLRAKTPIQGTGMWSQVGGLGFLTPTSPTEAFISEIGMGTNYYRWKVYNDYCSKDTVIKVISNSPKRYADAGKDTIVTKTEMALNAKFNITEVQGKWTIISGDGILDDEANHASYIRNLSPGQNTLRWTVSYKGCTAYDEVNILYVEEPIAGIGLDISRGCAPLSVTFNNKTVGGTKFFWDFGDNTPIVITNSIAESTTHKFEAGNFKVKLLAIGDYKTDSAFIDIEALPAPVVTFKALKDTLFFPSPEVQFMDDTDKGYAYLWNFGDGNTSIEKNPTHTYNPAQIKDLLTKDNNGYYKIDITLSVTDKQGCTGSSSITINIKDAFLVFPNAFIPNTENENDGSYDPNFEGEDRKTDVFYPIWKGVDNSKSYSLQVFNRWGELIFQSNDIYKGWNGYQNGKLVPQGVYIYKASGTFSYGKGFTLSGEISVIR